MQPNSIRLLLPFITRFALIGANAIGQRSPFDNSATQRYEIWANLAISYVRNISCDLTFFAVPDQCKQMKLTPSERMNVYSAEAGKHRKLMAVLPDGTMGRSGVHDGLVVIDPFPVASFGHLIIAFFVDRFDRVTCELYGGIYIENHNDCLRLALKDSCHNLLTLQRQATHKLHRCEIDFLPHVYEVAGNTKAARKASTVDQQKLQCRELRGFARCPTPVQKDQQRSIRHAVSSGSSEDERALEIRCQLFEICDHAVLVHGQWGQLTNRKGDSGILGDTKRMLARAGFPENNVNVFYKNGQPDDENAHGRHSSRNENETAVSIYPSANKRRLRSYIQLACSRLYCVDSLAIFMKGPALQDGSLLLYDANMDGLASQDEMYTVDEMLSDLSNCQARRVFVVADYSYSGHLTAALEREQRMNPNGAYDNLVAVSSGDQEQYSWDNQFTKSWTNENHRSNCFRNIFRGFRDLISGSTPTIFDGSQGDEDSSTTLCGAPCNVYPPLTDKELGEKYLGCNNVPSWLWFHTMGSNSTATPSPPQPPNRNRRRK